MNVTRVRSLILPYLIYTVCLAAVVLLSVNIYWSVDNPEIVRFNDDSVKKTVTSEATIFSNLAVEPDSVTPDQDILLTLNYCKLVPVHGAIIARLVGQHFTVRLTWSNDATGEGCINRKIPINIPSKSEDDLYYVEFDIDYHINPLRTSKIIIRSEQFNVKAMQ